MHKVVLNINSKISTFESPLQSRLCRNSLSTPELSRTSYRKHGDLSALWYSCHSCSGKVGVIRDFKIGDYGLPTVGREAFGTGTRKGFFPEPPSWTVRSRADSRSEMSARARCRAEETQDPQTRSATRDDAKTLKTLCQC